MIQRLLLWIDRVIFDYEGVKGHLVEAEFQLMCLRRHHGFIDTTPAGIVADWCEDNGNYRDGESVRMWLMFRDNCLNTLGKSET